MLTCLYDIIGYDLLGSMYLCVYFHAIWLDPCLYMLICLDPCSSMSMYQASTCLHACFYAYMSRSMLSHAYVLGSMSFTCFMLSSMYLCTPCHVCVPRPRPCLSCHVLLQPFVACLSFLCFGLMVRTQSRPYALCHHPYTKAQIKGFGSPLFAFLCLLLCFMLMLTSLVLGFAMLDAFSGFVVVWLHLMPVRPCLDVTIWDASP